MIILRQQIVDAPNVEEITPPETSTLTVVKNPIDTEIEEDIVAEELEDTCIIVSEEIVKISQPLEPSYSMNDQLIDQYVDEVFESLLADAIVNIYKSPEDILTAQNQVSSVDYDSEAMRNEMQPQKLLEPVEPTLKAMDLVDIFLRYITYESDSGYVIKDVVYDQIVEENHFMDRDNARLIFDCVNESIQISVAEFVQFRKLSQHGARISTDDLRCSVFKLLREWNNNKDLESATLYLVAQDMKPEERLWNDIGLQEDKIQDTLVEMLWEDLVNDFVQTVQ